MRDTVMKGNITQYYRDWKGSIHNSPNTIYNIFYYFSGQSLYIEKSTLATLNIKTYDTDGYYDETLQAFFYVMEQCQNGHRRELGDDTVTKFTRTPSAPLHYDMTWHGRI